MTLALSSNRNDFVGNGSTNTFSFTFVAFLSSDLAVYVTDTNGNQTTLALGADYTVAGLNAAGAPPASGSITLVNNSQAWLTSGNLITNYKLAIVRTVTLQQNTSIRNQGDFYPEVIENAFDELTMQAQQISAPSIVLPPGLSPSTFSPVLPTNLPQNPGAVLQVDPTGTKLVVGVANPSSIAVPVAVAQGGTGSGSILTGNRVMVSQSGQKIVEASAITASSAVASDANGLPTASSTTAAELAFVHGVTSAIQTQLNAKQGTLTAGQLPGTATNDSATAGNVGEVIEVVTSTNTNYPATTAFGDLGSITLTAGNWMVSLMGIANLSGATPSGDFEFAIGTVSGNNATGGVYGDTRTVSYLVASTLPQVTVTIPPKRYALSGSTTLYLKYMGTYSAGTPVGLGRLTAWRVR